MVSALYLNRRLIWQRSMMDLRHRYAGTGLGFIWNILHPLSLIGVYSLVFGMLRTQVLADVDAPYPIYLCAGLLPWLGFSECINRGGDAFLANAAYLKRLPVPEQVFVAQSAVTATLNMFISFTLLIIVAMIWGLTPNWHWLVLPLPLLLLQCAGMGLGMLVGTLNAFITDLGHAVSVGLRLAMWLSPVIFPLSFYIDHGLGPLVALNPATPAINAVRDLFFFNRMPSTTSLASLAGWVVISWACGLTVLHLLKREIRDVL